MPSLIGFFGYAFMRDAINDTTRLSQNNDSAIENSKPPKFGAQEGTRTPTMLLAST